MTHNWNRSCPISNKFPTNFFSNPINYRLNHFASKSNYFPSDQLPFESITIRPIPIWVNSNPNQFSSDLITIQSISIQLISRRSVSHPINYQIILYHSHYDYSNDNNVNFTTSVIREYKYFNYSMELTFNLILVTKTK